MNTSPFQSVSKTHHSQERVRLILRIRKQVGWGWAGSYVCLPSWKSLAPTGLAGKTPSTWALTPISVDIQGCVLSTPHPHLPEIPQPGPFCLRVASPRLPDPLPGQAASSPSAPTCPACTYGLQASASKGPDTGPAHSSRAQAGYTEL